jgi:hypothetical protein
VIRHKRYFTGRCKHKNRKFDNIVFEKKQLSELSDSMVYIFALLDAAL